MGDRDILQGCQISDGACQFKDAMVGAGRKLRMVHGSTDQATPGFIQHAKTPDLGRMHIRIARYSHVSKTLPLNLTSSLNPFSYISRRLPKLIISEFLIFNTRNFDVDVNPIKKRTRYAFLVFRNDGVSAGTGLDRVAVITTRAGIY